MEVAVIGCGYVGLVTAACLARIGHTVVGVEKDAAKLRMLRSGRCPIFEPGLHELVQERCALSSLQFTDDLVSAVRSAQIIFLAVGTPPRADGTVEMSHMAAAAGALRDALLERNSRQPATIVIKSTVPVGTNRGLDRFLREHTQANFQVVSNPEFLREGSAMRDFLEPDRIVIGSESPEAVAVLRRLYDPIVQREERFISMSWESAELTKYAANTMLALRISFMNEMTVLCEAYGADIEEIRRGVGADVRIGPAFLRAGCGFGGSCFPKDVAALSHISRAIGYQNRFVDAIQAVNQNQKARFVERLVEKLGRPIEGATIAIWGLAFKADTDDIRESPAIDIIRDLLNRGARIRATDPQAMQNMRAIFNDEVEWLRDPVSAAVGADAVAILTDWTQYTTLPFRKIAATMNQPLIFDGRNCLQSEVMRKHGFRYHPIGRPSVDDGQLATCDNDSDPLTTWRVGV